MGIVHDQLRERRRQLGLQQKDMPLQSGMTRQQYQRLESGGNPSLKTLELVAAGLDLSVMLIPKEHLRAVKALLARRPTPLYHLWQVAKIILRRTHGRACYRMTAMSNEQVSGWRKL